MAEAALFSVASKLLTTIASPAFDVAYERVRSIWGAKEELDELRETIETIQANLLDAEKQHKDTAGVKNWIDRVRDVLYDAEDLFDEVATHDRIKQHMNAGKHMKEEISIKDCEGQLTSFRCEGLTSLRRLQFVRLRHLRNVELAPNLVEEFTVYNCPELELELWESREEEERSVDWGSFTNLRLLSLEDIPEPEKLPDCLQQLVSLGKLQIEKDGGV